MFKKLRFRTPSEIQHVRQSENLHHSTSITLFHRFGKNQVGKVRLSASKILGVFANTHTANEKYSLRNNKSFPAHI